MLSAGNLTSSKDRSLGPIHSQHTASAEAHTLSEVDTAPEIHSNHTTAEAHTTKVEDSCVTDVRQASKMSVLESLVDSLIKITIVDLVGLESGKSSRNLGQLTAEVHALLVSTLSGSGQGSELGVDLVQELGELAVVESAGVVLVILLEEQIQSAKMVGCLREAPLHSSGKLCPLREGEVHLLRVTALLPGDRAEESDNVFSNVVLNCRAVADGVNIAQRSTDHSEMSVGLKGMLVVLSLQLVREGFGNLGAS